MYYEYYYFPQAQTCKKRQYFQAQRYAKYASTEHEILVCFWPYGPRMKVHNFLSHSWFVRALRVIGIMVRKGKERLLGLQEEHKKYFMAIVPAKHPVRSMKRQTHT